MSDGSDAGGQEKSFDPTPGRLERARREGDIALSREANAAAAYAGLFLAVVGAAAAACAALAEGLAFFFHSPEDAGALIFSSAHYESAALVGAVAAPTAVFFLLPAAGALAALFAQRGIVFAPSKLKPKWSRLSPVDNAKQKFGPQGLSEFLISAVKLIGILALFAAFFAAQFLKLPAAALATPFAVLDAVHRMAALFIGVIVVFAVVVAAVDMLRVRAQHKKRLMMSLEDIRRESKESEGDPHMKQSRRERAKAIATNRMLLDVPKASVVIVNPTHYAVALKWDGPKSGAPQCVAKGVDEMAAKIREVAAISGVPIRSDPPTARAIYGVVEVGEEVKREHYAAVAAAIHFAETIRKAARG